MATNSRLTDLRLALSAQGGLTARDLCARLRVSQPTLSRLIAEAGDEVLRLGQARSTRYHLRRNLRRMGRSFPLYRVEADGVIRHVGELEAVCTEGFHLSLAGKEEAPGWLHTFAPDHLFPGLPFFLQDARPQGFLGRAIAQRLPGLHLPTDPREWTGDDAMEYFLSEGHDLPGAFVVGDAAAQRASASLASTVLEKSCAPVLEELAERATRGEIVGSSAGGEQPKFATTLVRPKGKVAHVLVKFTVEEESPVRTRWADLLACEHHALATLREELGLPSTSSRLLEHGGRRFLIAERFDRIGEKGRRGVVSLGSILDAQGPDGIDRTTDWTTTSEALERAGLITPESARHLKLQHIFGQLIANTDMHAGNFSFFLGDRMPLEACPAYDMLPMAFAPNNQGSMRTAVPVLPIPAPRHAEEGKAAQAAALSFWNRVSDDPLVSSGFQEIARAMMKQLRNR